MEIPYYIFLIAYIISAFFAVLFFSFNMYHVVKYALQTTVSIFVTTFFVIGFVIMVGVTAVFIVGTDWQQTFSITVGL